MKMQQNQSHCTSLRKRIALKGPCQTCSRFQAISQRRCFLIDVQWALKGYKDTYQENAYHMGNYGAGALAQS